MPTPILRYFNNGHQPSALRAISSPYLNLALAMDAMLPDGPEKSTALRKLLESKDCAVRAALDIEAD